MTVVVVGSKVGWVEWSLGSGEVEGAAGGEVRQSGGCEMGE